MFHKVGLPLSLEVRAWVLMNHNYSYYTCSELQDHCPLGPRMKGTVGFVKYGKLLGKTLEDDTVTRRETESETTLKLIEVYIG